MLNEGYFEMFYQKELKNSDILGKKPFFMKISKISKSKFPEKCFFTQNTTLFRLFLMKYHKIYLLVSVFLLFCMIFVDFWLSKRAKNPRGGGPPSEAQGGYFAKFSTSGGVFRQYPPFCHQC